MISSDTVKSLANKLQTTELNIRREYIQHLFLSYFYLQKETSSIYFKGGTALRIVFDSPRFSEDLDFSTPLRNIKLIEEVVLETLQAIEKEGIKAEIIESKKTTGGYLGQLQFFLGSELISIELNISQREKPVTSEVFTVASEFVPSYIVVCMCKTELVDEKIQALLSRQKPRDFFDLYFILRKNLLSTEEKHVLPRVLKTLEKSTINFDAELKQFLPKSHWLIIKDFKTTLEREIQRSS